MICKILNSAKSISFSNNNKELILRTCHDVIAFLEDLAQTLKMLKDRLLSEEELKILTWICQSIGDGSSCQCAATPVEETLIISQMFRCLRDSCVEREHNQNGIRRFDGLYDSTLKCFKSILRLCIGLPKEITTDSSNDIVALRCGLQFYGNFIVQNEENQNLVWGTFSNHKEHLFRSLFEVSDEKAIDYTAMVFYNSLNTSNLEFFLKSDAILMTSLIIESFVNKKGHWNLLIIEKLIEKLDFWEIYVKLPIMNRLLVLDVISEQLTKTTPNICEKFIEELSSSFEHIVLDILKSVKDTDEKKPLEIVKCLSVLSMASVCSSYDSLLKRNTNLLEVSVDALKAVHFFGKRSSNIFTPIQNLRSKEEKDEDLEASPAYGFKKDLVRLIGNLCAGSQKNQDKVREIEGIPLLLDCCSMDAKNPFITQWCVFAIRNVMENNPANQAVLAELTASGELVDSPLLREMGLNIKQKPDGKFSMEKL